MSAYVGSSENLKDLRFACRLLSRCSAAGGRRPSGNNGGKRLGAPCHRAGSSIPVVSGRQPRSGHRPVGPERPSSRPVGDTAKYRGESETSVHHLGELDRGFDNRPGGSVSVPGVEVTSFNKCLPSPPRNFLFLLMRNFAFCKAKVFVSNTRFREFRLRI